MGTLTSLSQINRSAMSRSLHVDLAHISRIASGQRRPSLTLAKRMADYLGISLDELNRLIDDVASKGVK